MNTPCGEAALTPIDEQTAPRAGRGPVPRPARSPARVPRAAPLVAACLLVATGCGSASRVMDATSGRSPVDAEAGAPDGSDAAEVLASDGGASDGGAADGGEADASRGPATYLVSDRGGANEPTIALRGHTPIVAFQSSGGTYHVSVARWLPDAGGFSPPVGAGLDPTFAGDPTLAVTPDGTTVVAGICALREICGVASSDGGASFGAPFLVSEPNANPAGRMRDRPWIAAAPDGRLVATYFESDYADGDVERSTGYTALRLAVGVRAGAGYSFSTARVLAQTAAVAEQATMRGYFATMAFDAAGRLHLAFQLGTSPRNQVMYLRSSSAALDAFETPRRVAYGNLPVVATSGGGVAVAYLTPEGGAAVARSTNGGDAFDTVTPAGDAVFRVWIAGGAPGVFHLTSYALEGDTVQTLYQQLGAVDGPVVALTEPFTARLDRQEIGDFHGIASDGDATFVTWTDTVAGHPAVRVARIGSP